MILKCLYAPTIWLYRNIKINRFWFCRYLFQDYLYPNLEIIFVWGILIIEFEYIIKTCYFRQSQKFQISKIIHILLKKAFINLFLDIFAFVCRNEMTTFLPLLKKGYSFIIWIFIQNCNNYIKNFWHLIKFKTFQCILYSPE